MSVLVTGGTGFLGSHLVRQLAAAGDEPVRVLSRRPPAWLHELGVEVVSGSVTSRSDVAAAVEGVEQIYHLAGDVSRSAADGRRMYDVHVEGTRILCEAARIAGAESMVLVSSSGTLAVSRDAGEIATESSPVPLEIVLRWPYYASKIFQERTALDEFQESGHRLVILNPSLLLGPGDDRLSSTKVVLDFLQRTLPAVPPGGVSFVDARDVALACRAAMRHGAPGERYLLGAANWTFRELFNRLERLTKVPAPRVTIPARLGGPAARALGEVGRRLAPTYSLEPAELEMASYFWYLDSSKAHRQLAFAPRDPLETLHDTVTYLRQRFLEWPAFAERPLDSGARVSNGMAVPATMSKVHPDSSD